MKICKCFLIKYLKILNLSQKFNKNIMIVFKNFKKRYKKLIQPLAH